MDVDGTERMKRLYPFVDQTKTPLPSCWSAKDKFQYLGLTQNNLRVHYKGQGKTHKDAAAVRSDHPIPSSCGLYYFEVRIISKGRDGFMGIGLSQQGVSLNRLPGWDRFSYGYHGDDGNSFCSSGSGLPYGPTFTTDDVIGCGVNFIDNTCFYTKNGYNIGVAFTDLPGGLYPTVGLQTPGEIVDANFGHMPFVYDVMEDLKEAQLRVQTSIERFILSPAKSEWFNKLVSGYLVHHGFCATAEAFGSAGGQAALEDVVSIKHRQSICRLIKSGRISEAIRQVQLLYPTLFEQKPDLLFLLKCRQFVEMLTGNDSEIRRPSPRSSHSASPASSPPQYKLSSHLPSKSRPSPLHSPKDSPRSSPRRIKSPRPRNSATPSSETDHMHERVFSRNGCEAHRNFLESADASVENGKKADNGNYENGSHANESNAPSTTVVTADDGCGVISGTGCPSATSSSSPSAKNGAGYVEEADKEMDGDFAMAIDGIPPTRTSAEGAGSRAEHIERLIAFGRELHQFCAQLKQQNVLSLKSQRILQDAFSLMAYPDPWNCPVSYQLHASQREPVAAALNSAILELQGYPPKPGLEIINAHARRLRDEMASQNLSAAVFADPSHYFDALSSRWTELS